MWRAKDDLFVSHLKDYANDMYNQAGLISRSVQNFEEYTKAQHELRELRQKLQVSTTS